MVDAPVPQPAGEGKFQAGSLVGRPLPDEMVYPLRNDEFQTLCQGEMSDAKSARDLSIGGCLTAFVALIGVFLTVDWDTQLKPEHRFWFLLWFIVLVLIGGVSVFGIFYSLIRMKRNGGNSPFSRLKKRIEKWFSTQAADVN